MGRLFGPSLRHDEDLVTMHPTLLRLRKLGKLGRRQQKRSRKKLVRGNENATEGVGMGVQGWKHRSMNDGTMEQRVHGMGGKSLPCHVMNTSIAD